MDESKPRQRPRRNSRKLWRLESHTAAKHELLGRYLKRWIPIMARWNPKIAYVDCFAGPGEYSGGEPGSPIIALDIARSYVTSSILKPGQLSIFAIESGKGRFEHLREQYRSYQTANPDASAINTELIRGRYEDCILDVNTKIAGSGAFSYPTFYLVDPCGVKDTPYILLPRLLGPDKNEVLFNLMYEETNRFINEPEFEIPLDSMFGESEWRALRALTGSTRKQQTVAYFKGRLKVAGAKYVAVFEMRNSRNATDYFLFYATKSLEGLRVMKEAMWHVDRSGQFSFSDYTYSLGPMLITLSPDYSVLQSQIMTEYRGRRFVPIADIDEFVLAETSFFRFMKDALQPMISRNECFVEATADNPGARLSNQAQLGFITRSGTPLRLFAL